MESDQSTRTSSELRRRMMAAFLGLLLVALLVIACVKINDASVSTARAVAFSEIVNSKTLLDERARPVASILSAAHVEYRDNARRWSFVYHTAIFGAAILSALAGLVLKLEYFLKDDGLKKDLAACLAMIAALFAAVSSSGNFHDKWEANRIAASKIESFAFDLKAHPFTLEREQAIYAELRDLTLERDLRIVGQGEAKDRKADSNTASIPKSPAGDGAVSKPSGEQRK